MRRHRGPNGPSGPGPLFTGALLLFPFSLPPQCSPLPVFFSSPPSTFHPTTRRLRVSPIRPRPQPRTSILPFAHPSAVPDTSSASRTASASLACKCTLDPSSPVRHHDRDSALPGRDHNNAPRPPQRARLDRSMIPATL
ncbi:hypothetical protein LZ32DRAFT_276334 [Colletotrichum eremochloae]|nr:hypothetical protein LZ32DRAFT_276334 [Colletotrichum eremochloae]